MQSAISNNPGSRGFLICVDREGERLLQEIVSTPNLLIIPFENLFLSKTEYEKHLTCRTKFEALISIKPTLLNEISVNFDDGEHFIYLDTDVYFFDSIDKYLKKNGDLSFIVFQHMYVNETIEYRYGKYNAGFVILRKNNHSRAILDEWSRLCSEWCFIRSEPGRFADQGYLDRLVNHPFALGDLSTSINLGMHYPLTKETLKQERGRIRIYNESLICFHFHGLRIGNRVISTGLNRYGFRYSNLYIYRIVYKPVIQRLKSNAKKIKRIKPSEKYLSQQISLENANGKLRTFIDFVKSLIIRTFLIYR